MALLIDVFESLELYDNAQNPKNSLSVDQGQSIRSRDLGRQRSNLSWFREPVRHTKLLKPLFIYQNTWEWFQVTPKLVWSPSQNRNLIFVLCFMYLKSSFGDSSRSVFLVRGEQGSYQPNWSRPTLTVPMTSSCSSYTC